MKKKLVAIPVIAMLAAVTLTACGDDADTASTGSSDTSSQQGAQFNDADVTFAQEMIAHHEQAIEMADMGVSQASDPEVKQLAEDIQAAQGPEIDQMTSWLESWGEDVSSDGMEGMDHGDMGGDMPGMMTDDDMAELKGATGAEFDQMFLEMMIEHHEGAVDMAKTEQANGENPDAVALAEKIVADQEAEIAKMQEMLDS